MLLLRQVNWPSLPSSLRVFVASTCCIRQECSSPASQARFHQNHRLGNRHDGSDNSSEPSQLFFRKVRFVRSRKKTQTAAQSRGNIDSSIDSSSSSNARTRTVPQSSSLTSANVASLDRILKAFQSTELSPAEMKHARGLLRAAQLSLENTSQHANTSLLQRKLQYGVSVGYYRGGTSRAIMIRKEAVPHDKEKFFLQVMGSPDPYGRQLNGMGAGISSLSKICIVDRSTMVDADIDYTFVGVGIEGNETDFAGNCGNMSAAVGPFAYNRMLIDKCLGVKEGEVTVMIYQTNTKKYIRSRFRVAGGQALVDDKISIDGVSGLGTGVMLDFLDPAGSKTGKLLPTGNVVDTLCGVEVSCVDAANPCVFVLAQHMGLDPAILPSDILKEKEVLQKLEEIRTAGAVAMGLCNEGEMPPRVIPKIGIVSSPVQQKTLSGMTVEADQLDLVVRFISDTQPHRAIPVTAALCTAAAAKIKGSIVHQCLRDHMVDGDMITIGHPSGRIQVNAKMDYGGHLESCSIVRTARRIMDGRIFWSKGPF